MHAHIVLDLGFGDAGKGLITDFLARQRKAGLVVRYNGGAQAGHNVVTPDGLHHTFSQFGSGTFVPGVKTYLSKFMVIHPTALLVEGDRLAALGVEDVFARLRINPQCLVITPFHQSANRIRELMRGASRHGSCGVGVGETVEDARAQNDDCIYAADLYHPDTLRQKLASIRGRKREGLISDYGEKALKSLAGDEWVFFEHLEVMDAWLGSVARISELDLVAPDDLLSDWFHKTEHAVFEGAQGVLLDADAGLHPHTSWSDCTTRNAHELIAELAPDSQTTTIGVLRCYSVRHGAGPLPTETRNLIRLVSEHNHLNDWQGAVRYGWFDPLLVRYALNETAGVDYLAVTHMDVLSRLNEWKYCVGYKSGGPLYTPGDISNDFQLIHDVPSQRMMSLEDRVAQTKSLQKVEPVYETCPSSTKEVINHIESLTGRPIGLISRGPKSLDVEYLEHGLK